MFFQTNLPLTSRGVDEEIELVASPRAACGRVAADPIRDGLGLTPLALLVDPPEYVATLDR